LTRLHSGENGGGRDDTASKINSWRTAQGEGEKAELDLHVEIKLFPPATPILLPTLMAMHPRPPLIQKPPGFSPTVDTTYIRLACCYRCTLQSSQVHATCYCCRCYCYRYWYYYYYYYYYYYSGIARWRDSQTLTPALVIPITVTPSLLLTCRPPWRLAILQSEIAVHLQPVISEQPALLEQAGSSKGTRQHTQRTALHSLTYCTHPLPTHCTRNTVQQQLAA
jgi:hypothetical protein